MLVVGDSRVKEMERQKDSLAHPGWRVECLSTKGAGLDRSVQDMQNWKECYFPDRPRLIVMVSFLCDVLELTNLPDGTITLRMNEAVEKGNVYPALAGLESKIRQVERLLNNWWKGVDVLWIIPHPVDVRRWTTRKMANDGSLSGTDIEECHQASYDSARWLEKANWIGSRISGIGDRIIPWFVMWNDRSKTGFNYSRFMEKMPVERRFGWINHWRSKDGVHPTPAVARQLLALLYRKIGQTSVKKFSGLYSSRTQLKTTDKAPEPIPDREPSSVPDQAGTVSLAPNCDESDLPCSSTVEGAESALTSTDVDPSDDAKGGGVPSDIDCEEPVTPVDFEHEFFPTHLSNLSVVDAVVPRDVLEDSGATNNNDESVPRVGSFGDGCCVGHGDTSGPSGSFFHKITYPCGHTLPYTKIVDSSCTEEVTCSVCKGRWSIAKMVKDTFYHFSFYMD